jgi:hypothetical protein
MDPGQSRIYHTVRVKAGGTLTVREWDGSSGGELRLEAWRVIVEEVRELHEHRSSLTLPLCLISLCHREGRSMCLGRGAEEALQSINMSSEANRANALAAMAGAGRGESAARKTVLALPGEGEGAMAQLGPMLNPLDSQIKLHIPEALEEQPAVCRRSCVREQEGEGAMGGTTVTLVSLEPEGVAEG